eukprot:Skav234478  [mRNA]  locus=scaffold1647:327122:330094:- [translate_table: standard]
MNLSPEDLHELHAHLREEPAVHAAHLPWCHARAVTALRSDTWFRVGAQRDVTRTCIGSRPGDSYADVIFSYVFAKVLRSIHRTLVDMEVISWVPESYEPGIFKSDESPSLTACLGPTWMDDLCICAHAKDCHALVRKVSLAASVTIDTCRAFGMCPNLSPGKTEAMLDLRGAGSRALKLQHYGPNSSHTLPLICERETTSIHLVGQYRHLGGLLHHQGDNKKEIKRRIAIAHEAFNKHRRLIYQNRDAALPRRIELFQALILSKMVYGMESWCFDDQKTYATFASAVFRLCRRLLRLRPDEHVTDFEVLCVTGLPDPQELLRRARLRYLGTLHRCGGEATWGLLRADASWVAQVYDDVAWLWKQLENATFLEDPAVHWGKWQELLQFHPGYWKKLIRRALAHAHLQRLNQQKVIAMHQSVLHIVEDAGIWRPSLSDDPPEVPPHQTTFYGCVTCEQSCLSKAGQNAHMHKKHGYCESVRLLFQGTQCPSCLKEYHTSGKLQRHLRSVRLCRDRLRASGVRYTPQPGIGSAADQQAQHVHDGLLPVLQAAGPLMPLQGAGHQEQTDVDWQLLDDIMDCLLDVADDAVDAPSLESLLCACIQGRATSWTTCSATLHHAVRGLGVAEQELLGNQFDMVVCVLRQLASVESWPFLVNHTQRTTGSFDPSACLAELEETFASLYRSSSLLCRPVPHSIGRVRIFLHIFPGRRRRGDLQWYLEDAMQQFPDFTLVTVSLDYVIDETKGDVAQAEIQRMWLGAIADGYVIGVGVGPPCETWSRVRNVILTNKGGDTLPGPRVLREASCPWGRPSLRLREVNQVLMGNVLLSFALQCIAAVIVHGGCGFLEHPDEPQEDALVSIWKLPLVNFLSSLPPAQVVTLAQGLFGSESVKPTRLLTVRLCQLPAFLHRARLTDHPPRTASVGRNLDGSFKTSVLKEYPPAFCWALAQSIAAATVKQPPASDASIPAELMSICTSMQINTFGESIGADFCHSSR